MKEAQKNSVKQLAELYNVVIGIALSVAIFNLVDPTQQPFPFRNANWFGFGVILVTIIPFYHGAVRHLYATYVEYDGSSRIKSGALMLDFIILFLEGCLFVTLAISLANPKIVLYGYMLLLFVDSIWGLLAKLAFTGAESQAAEWKWSKLNVVTIVIVFVLMALFDRPDKVNILYWEKWTFFGVAFCRSVVDYARCWRFYYPADADPAD